MDLGSFVVGALSGLIVGVAVGVIVGRNNDLLARDRFRDERRAAEQREQLDHCRDVFAARLAYILAYHRKPATAKARQQEYHDLLWRYWDARPEVLVDGTIFTPHEEAEKAALDVKTGNLKERTQRVEGTAAAVLEWLAERRKKLID